MPINDHFTIQAGHYDRRILFQLKTHTQDSFGGFQDEWVDDFECWAAFEPKQSDLLPISDKRYAETIVLFRIRDVQGRVVDATKHRIVMVEDPNASPPLVSTWDIFPPLRRGRYRELFIKARRYQ